jgi:hypothetical protein
VIYLDSSVALAHLLGEDRSPPPSLWREPVSSSRLLEYEIWNRIHARGLTSSHGDEAGALIDRITLIDLTQPTLARALSPFPVSIRTLDGLHLATVLYLHERGDVIELASFDQRLLAAARAISIPLYQL